jgi:hypothetical protein
LQVRENFTLRGYFLPSIRSIFKIRKLKNMKKIKLFVCSLLLLTACNTATPDNYFDRAVLNTNQFNDFATDQFTNMLVAYTAAKQPNVTAKSVVENKVLFIEKAVKDVKALKETDETKEMLRTSIALHEYVLPVYKNEYMALAKLCDTGASKEVIFAKAAEINDAYGKHFDELEEKLTSEGKVFAKAHNIVVQWGRP